MSSSRKITIVSIIAVVALLMTPAVVSVTTPKTPPKTGTSTYPALDIVSGDIPLTFHQQILSSLSSAVGSDLSWGDIKIAGVSYHKSYSPGVSGYTVTFVADIISLKTSYQVALQNDGYTVAIIKLACTIPQPNGDTCVDVRSFYDT